MAAKKRARKAVTPTVAVRRLEKALDRWPLDGGLDGYHHEIRVVLDELAAYRAQAKEIHEIRLRLDRLMPMVRFIERTAQRGKR